VLWVNGLSMLVAALPLLANRVGATPASRWLTPQGTRSSWRAEPDLARGA
jgi:hypothetical protein